MVSLKTTVKHWNTIEKRPNRVTREAQFGLGVLYYKGWGVAQDYQKAGEWYQQAANQDNPEAQNNLANLYAEGLGVLQDFVQAYMWFTLAARNWQGARDAGIVRKKRIEEVGEGWSPLEARELIAQKMTPEQIAKAEKLIRRWTLPQQVDSRTGNKHTTRPK
ncbi:sel1 repeat family protein [Acidobacteria bacterium AH-259-G07]|nr:sel1 repeat family protein [Acidobacteria bacterium AH-259-G07]